MKNKIIWLVCGGIAVVVIVLVMANLSATQTDEGLYTRSSIQISGEGNVMVLEAEALDALAAVEFDAVYQRKVGPAQERRFTGIPLEALLEEAGMKRAGAVAVTSLDQYRVEIAPEESGVYLVMGDELQEGEGPYMLVTAEDALSTRWVKQVVRVEALG